MSDGFIDSYAALDARMRLIEVITNNLANSETTGFKREFGRILDSAQGLGVGTSLDTKPGDLINTKNDLDVAIHGDGFFAIQTPYGVRYTRNGSFSLNEAGDLVTKDGMKVLSTSGSPINVSGSRISIQTGGIVTAEGNEVATLKVVTFKNTEQLLKEGLNRLVWTGTPDGVQDVADAQVTSGVLERSNVNVMQEMVHLMTAYRDFESVQRTLRTLDTDINGRLIQELGNIT